MLAIHPSSVVQKRDLHVGGLGSSASGALAAVVEPVRDVSDSWFKRVGEVARDVDDYVHDSPWAALAIVAVIGLTAGFLLSRRTNS